MFFNFFIYGSVLLMRCVDAGNKATDFNVGGMMAQLNFVLTPLSLECHSGWYSRLELLKHHV